MPTLAAGTAMAASGPLAPRKEDPGRSLQGTQHCPPGRGQSSWGGAGARPALSGASCSPGELIEASFRLVPARARRPPAQRTHPESSPWRRRKNLSLRGPSAQGMFPTPAPQPKGPPLWSSCLRTTHKPRINITAHSTPPRPPAISGPSTQEISDYAAFTLLSSKHTSTSKHVPYFIFLKHILNLWPKHASRGHQGRIPLSSQDLSPVPVRPLLCLPLINRDPTPSTPEPQSPT